MINDNLIYTILKENHNKKDLTSLLKEHTEIKFVSFAAVDLSGNDTDEKIPIKVFLNNLDLFLYGTAIQTDGSSVVLPGIATLNDAKVDMIADLDVNWFIDYNYDYIDSLTNNPIGTLRIPCFLYHNNTPVCSRHILKSAITTFKEELMNIFSNNSKLLEEYNVSFNDIEEINITCATELEFWVSSPNNIAKIEELSTSQELHEQYWTRIKGSVRTALEETLILMEKYGLNPEMGHKEVGGVRAKLSDSGQFDHIMEQLEIDWKYDDAIQAADNELFIKILIQETFRKRGLDVTFMAKPIENVAGSGMHTHLGASLKLKNNKMVNIFNSQKGDYLSLIGYGALMGILKNYEVMNPFISSTNNSLKRLKPGFEAPVCIVTSLGTSPKNPSRNRSVLVGLIRDINNPLATRFELRSPNPHSNIYLTIVVSYMAMLDGILYAVNSKKSEKDLLKELSKKAGEDSDYLEKSREYRSENDVFQFYDENKRNALFGRAPLTVYENLKNIIDYPEKLKVLKRNNVMTDSIINSFKLAAMQRWSTEITNRILNKYINEIRSYKPIHTLDKALDMDISNWIKINDLRYLLMKDTCDNKSLFTKLKDAFNNNDYLAASNLYITIENIMDNLRQLYKTYSKNILNIN